MSLETDFPILEDWERFQNDLNFDPYLGRQPETQVTDIYLLHLLVPIAGPDGLECGHPLDVGHPLAGVKNQSNKIPYSLPQTPRMVQWG